MIRRLCFALFLLTFGGYAVAQEEIGEAPRRAEGAPGSLRADAKGARNAAAQQTAELTLADLFPRKSFFGKTARGLAWSHNDRYLAYLWNPYEDRGFDLWVYDTKESRSRRLTSIEIFSAFDRELPPIIERYKKEHEEDERRKKLSDAERKKLEEEDEQKERDRKEPLKEYAGVSEFVWANRSEEILLVYRGDIYRMKVSDPAPTRLIKTQEAESGVKFSRDDRAFYFRRGSGVFRMRFDSAMTEQLNPELPNNMQMGSYILSPDETKILITAGRTTGPSREVTYITYRDRFAQARTTQRAVADDPFRSESYAYLYDLNDDPKANPKNDGKPWEIYKWTGGEDLGQFITADEPWSPDSRRLVFATWERDKRSLQIVIADMEAKKITPIYKTTHNGEHTTPGMTDPRFTPDGRRVLALLEQSGYRHMWLIDPLTQGATQLTRGDFEVYPEKMTQDGKVLFVRAQKEHPARMDLYRVDMANGEMTRITTKDGRYSNPEFSHDFKKIGVTFVSWKSPAELYVMSAESRGKESVVTASHPGTFEKVNRLSPELFSYRNRHGHTVYGFMFRPPDLKKEDRRPLLIYVYGGPLGTGKQVVDGTFGGDSYLFNMYLAYRMGYVTVTIDPRGTSGYGGLFGNANWEAPGKAQVEDLTDGVKYLIENYGVDPQKVGIYGWSFGGFQTQMCLYTAPETFTLGIAGAGPTEWQNYNNWYVGGVIGTPTPRKAENLDKFSLTHLAKNLKAPLLLLHGMEDTNVLAQDTIKVYRELLKAGKGPLVELVLDPTGGHGLGGDIRTRDRMLIYESFIQRRWGPYRR